MDFMECIMATCVVCVMFRKLSNFYQIVIHHKALSWSVTETSISLPCIYYCQDNDRRPQVFTDIWWEMKVYWLCTIKIRRSLWYFTLFVPVVLGQLQRCQPWKLSKTEQVSIHTSCTVLLNSIIIIQYIVFHYVMCWIVLQQQTMYMFWYAWTCACIFYHISSTISYE